LRPKESSRSKRKINPNSIKYNEIRNKSLPNKPKRKRVKSARKPRIIIDASSISQKQISNRQSDIG